MDSIAWVLFALVAVAVVAWLAYHAGRRRVQGESDEALLRISKARRTMDEALRDTHPDDLDDELRAIRGREARRNGG